MRNKSKANQAGSIQTRCYFYTNAIFMGTTKSLQRVGSGLILFNDGCCAVVSYNTNSQFHGRSIFYKDRCIVSVNFIRNRIVDLVYRIDGFLLYLKYNQSAKIDGDCYIISFTDHSIHHIRYQQGLLKSKTKMLTIDKITVQSIFLNQSFHSIIGKQHNRAMRHQITNQEIEKIRMRKLGNKVQVNYMQNSQDRLVQGLGFQLIYRAPQNGGYNPQMNRFKDQFQLKVVQKGMYKDNMLEGYGMRIFKNNNIYQGYFKTNVFHKQGCLKNTYKGNWVYGVFANGQMQDILDFSNEGNQQSKCKIFLQSLRQRQPQFINQMIQQNNFDFLDVQIQKISARGDIEIFKNQCFQDKKLQLMKKITEQFTQLQGINKHTLQQQLTKFKKANEQLNQTRKTDKLKDNQKVTQKKQPYKIKYLIPQSLKNSNLNNFGINKSLEREVQKMEISKQKFEKRLMATQPIKTHKDQQGIKYSKIFHKIYTHLQNQNQNLNQKQQLSKQKYLTKAKRQRKQLIFKTNNNNNTPRSGISERNSHSPNNLGGSTFMSPYSRRSPNRKTAIFQSSVKLKKLGSKTRNNINSNEDLRGDSRLYTIRKDSGQKKILEKSKIKRSPNSPIFDQNKEKDQTSKFVYTYQDVQKMERTDAFTASPKKKNKTDKMPLVILNNLKS